MTAFQDVLPAEFEALAPFMEFWAANTSAKRAACRDESTEQQRQDFYSVMKPLLPQLLEYLDEKSLAVLDEADQCLMQLALSFAHVAMAVELQREEEPGHARWRHFMRITTTPADS